MGTRISLGKGFTAGRSGLRYGHSIPHVPRGYASVGASGTLLTGGPLRHWQPAGRRTGSGTMRCGGLTRAGSQCANTATLGLVCRRHVAQVAEAGIRHGEFLAANPPPPASRWEGLGSLLAIVAVLAVVWGVFAFMEQASQDYCDKNTGSASASICVGHR